jgi:N-acetyl-anhydromuramyl-L-alanine amidase AmpD
MAEGTGERTKRPTNNYFYPDYKPPRKMPRVYPHASSVIEPHGMAVGSFVGSQPSGITVHYSADRDVGRVIQSLKDHHLGYHLLIDRDGKIIQLCYLDKKVSHAGKATWLEKSCNSWHLAVCLISWGWLESDYTSWAGVPVDPTETAHRVGNLNKKKKLIWDAATDIQQEKLFEIMRWFISYGMDPRAICGHDEAAVPAGRKADPGGVLLWTMEQIRTILCAESKIKYP